MPTCFSRARLCDTGLQPTTLLSMGLSRQECWGGLPCPPSGRLPDPGIKPTSPTSCTGRWIRYHFWRLGSPLFSYMASDRVTAGYDDVNFEHFMNLMDTWVCNLPFCKDWDTFALSTNCCSVTKSCLTLWDPRSAACQAPLSFTISWSLLTLTAY